MVLRSAAVLRGFLVRYPVRHVRAAAAAAQLKVALKKRDLMTLQQQEARSVGRIRAHAARVAADSPVA